ncbi:LAQU0S15e00320g1_1 [Lachancea quebecensis]|uniref:LAQU0S15e00320g1_1 n=1 Tax=Lachancea quebecensis TaxID=1654605 RepID=A0A0P1L235_9SACH|nr:LAQU0S15e00320g1_1 [Lachancea quebecensis]
MPFKNAADQNGSNIFHTKMKENSHRVRGCTSRRNGVSRAASVGLRLEGLPGPGVVNEVVQGMEATLPHSRALSQLAQISSIRSPIRNAGPQDYFHINSRETSTTKYGSTDQGTVRGGQLSEASLYNGSMQPSSSSKFFNLAEPVNSEILLPRNYYDDFTSVDWVKDYLYDVWQKQQMSSLRGLAGKLRRLYGNAQDWILITVVALSCSLLAFFIDKAEELLVDLKRGYCKSNFFFNQQQCCASYTCANWRLWPEVLEFVHGGILCSDFMVYTFLSLILALSAAKVTLTTKYINPLAFQTDKKIFKTMYHAYGSGVPEVKTILSGFIIRKFLGTYTLFSKSIALVLAIASGLSLGKEGPYVHLATCVGNIVSRQFAKFKLNGIERRVILSASAAAGVTLAFGSPLGGVLFSLEEVSYFLPGNQLFKTFFSAIMANLFLRLLNPYGTGKAALFEVKYSSDWQTTELFLVSIIGAIGGVFGAYFCKFVSFWGSWFRNKSFIRGKPLREVALIALLTASLTFPNSYTNISVAELLANLASPCFSPDDFTGKHGLCPVERQSFPSEIIPLSYALVVKVLLTSITFGIKVPAGIYVPSMVIGALFGRIFATWFEYLANLYPSFYVFTQICSKSGSDGVCIDMGIYAMISAGAFMAGVTRMNVTLAIIIFELTSSYNYVVPISIAIAVSNLVAHMIEPQSLYEMLMRKNDLPFLDNRKVRDFRNHSGLRDIVSTVKQGNGNIYVNLSEQATFPTATLRELLSSLQKEGLVDGCIPMLKNGKLAGVLPAPELELALDKLKCFADEFHLTQDFKVRLLEPDVSNSGREDTKCFASSIEFIPNLKTQEERFAIHEILENLCDLTSIVEKFPIMLDLSSSPSLVELIFTKLGNRFISVLDGDEFVGLVHRKNFIDYCRDKAIL